MKYVSEEAPCQAEHKKIRSALKWVLTLLTIVVLQGIVIAWFSTESWRRSKTSNGFQSTSQNLIRLKFPEVNFGAIYTELAADQIDLLQRECLSVHYVYSPFVEFEPLPYAGKWVKILKDGFRKGRSDAPWPPLKNEFVVFVFGGSTTFGFGLPDGQTVVDALEESLRHQFPNRSVRCYNFGRGYYFSSQERALFEKLLLTGHVPNVAIFIDGVNDFIYHDGIPELAPALVQFTAPDLIMHKRAEPITDGAREAAVEQVIARYRQNLKLTESIARSYGVSSIFIGQPVPFLDFPVKEATYPFRSTFSEHKLASWGYKKFKEAGRDGLFGDRFVWCGNAFADAEKIMYADSIHYSRAGADLLAKSIVERSLEVDLLP